MSISKLFKGSSQWNQSWISAISITYPFVHVCALLYVCVVLWHKNKTSDSREKWTGWSENQGGYFSVLLPSGVSSGTTTSVRTLALSQSTSFLNPITFWLWEVLEAKVFWSTMNKEPRDNWRWKECMFLFLSICSLEAVEYNNGSFLLPFFPSFCGTFSLTWNLREKLQRTVITSGFDFGRCFYKRYRKSCLEKTCKSIIITWGSACEKWCEGSLDLGIKWIVDRRGSRKRENLLKILKAIFFFKSEVMKMVNSAQSSYCLAFSVLFMLPWHRSCLSR